MPNIKYYCPNCGKKFVEWGAEKFGFKCPNCRDVQLERIGIRDDQIISTPKTRRKPRLLEDEGDIEFPDELLQEEEYEDFIGVPDVPVEEEEVIPLDEEVPEESVLPEDIIDETLPPEDEVEDIEEEE